MSTQKYTILKELPFSPEPSQIVYDDYSALSTVYYEYIVTPVDATGIEGIVTATVVRPEFDGWWIVDLDNPEEYNFQFLYNLDDVTINMTEDRTEMSTFGKYPLVRYGTKRARKCTLSGLFIPEGESTKEQYDKFDQMLTQRKPYLLKDKYGRKFVVDISSPQETILSRLQGVTKIAVNWVEVGEYED
ncbi:MAG: hypothetical protein N4A64_04605 [Marinisporobacter sp.]|nr:hypothetical protein [Marinisporobacter sp.]